ncbi:helix-turn-helix transcriptional regulator [Agromyces sp. NPDC057865]|uniref:helix-turn-helix transcriptional regulator n=1 Tax=Agromyces sp. NPDC057865 TaxID=3346267 RepID=UPI00366ED5C6
MTVTHLHATTVDLDEAEARLRAVYPSIRVHRPRGATSLILEERFDGDPRFNLVEFVFSMGSSAGQDSTPGAVIARTIGRPMSVSDGRTVTTTERPVLILPGVPLASTWDQVDAQAMLIPASTVEEYIELRVHSDERPNGEHLVRAPSQPLADQWNRFQDYLVRDFFRADGAFENELIRATTEELCVRMLLAVFFPPSSHRPVDGRGAMPASTQRAVAFVDEHAHEPITIADIADAARLSLRGLQAAFRRHLDTTPYEYLRIVRMNGAREELRHPDADTTVASAARAWGFAHLGRFAGEYRGLFGETPRVTLQRGRS